MAIGPRHISTVAVTVIVGVMAIFSGYHCLVANIMLSEEENTNSNGNIISEYTTNLTIATLSESMGFQGQIPECCCSFSEIEEVNRQTVYPLLKKIVDTPYFAHFKIDLCTSCELWHDMPFCTMKDCSVCECESPPTWSFDGVDEMPITGPVPGPDCTSIADDNVVTTIESYVIDGWQTTSSFDNSFLSGESISSSSSSSSSSSNPSNSINTDSTTAQVVDLRLNPEGYTGYTGSSAEKVWSAIHSTNCFQPTMDDTKENKDINTRDDDDDIDDDHHHVDEYCDLSSEQRLYNRFISGLHSSISLHIAHSYCLEMNPTIIGECQMWGLNDTMAYDRVLKYPDRVENLYVAFSLLLRAVVKAGVAITAAVPEQLDDIQATRSSSSSSRNHHSGDEDDDDDDSLLLTSYWNDSLLPELISLPQKCPNTFNESALLSDIIDDHDSVVVGDVDQLKSKRKTELQRRFQHLTSIMQCVGCDRCKLWGTLQTLGVGTALRILFHNDDNDNDITLSRQEAVALVNTLERLSSSLDFAYEFRKRKERKDLFPFNTNKNDEKTSCS